MPNQLVLIERHLLAGMGACRGCRLLQKVIGVGGGVWPSFLPARRGRCLRTGRSLRSDCTFLWSALAGQWLSQCLQLSLHD